MSYTKEFLETVSEQTGRKGQVTKSVIKYAQTLLKKQQSESS